MDVIDFQALSGGLLIGVAASLLLLGSGRVAGISGILGELAQRQPGPQAWRALFVLGLIAAPLVWRLGVQAPVPGELTLSAPLLVVAGLLVGFGTRRANGCTSGHGVCGLGNLSPRSLVAVVTFMGVAAVTVFVVRHVIGA